MGLTNPGREDALRCGPPARILFPGQGPRRAASLPRSEALRCRNRFRQATDRLPRWSSKTVEELGMVVAGAGILVLQARTVARTSESASCKEGLRNRRQTWSAEVLLIDVSSGRLDVA